MLGTRRHLLAGGLALAAARLAWAAEAEPPAGKPSTALPGVTMIDTPLPMPGLARERRLRLWLPASHAGGNRRYPVIYMHDAQNLFDEGSANAGEWGVDEAMETLARRTGFEAIVVGIDHGGDRRINELSPWPNPRFGAAEGKAYTAFIVDVVKPWVDRHYRTRPGFEDTAMVGSSLAALVTQYALCQYPDVFGKAAIFSPAYWFSEQVYATTAAAPPRADARLYLYAGGRESDTLLEEMRRMHALLAATREPGQGLHLHIDPAGAHDEAAWRAEFPAAVAWLFRLQ